MRISKHITRATRKELDRLFVEIAELGRRIADLQAAHEAEIRGLTRIFQSRLAPLQADYDACDKALRRLIRIRRQELFEAPGADGCRAVTALGQALRQTGTKLKTSRRTLELCEQRGLTEAVKIVKSLDRARLAACPPERLACVEAELKPFVKYDYELHPTPEADQC